MAWVSHQTKLSYKYRRRTHTVTPSLEESYLRVDVSCASEACDSCCVGFGADASASAAATTVGSTPTSSLSASAPFYLIPDDEALYDLLELFELPDISNYVILTSCLKRVSLQSGRKASRLRALYRDRRRCAVLFDDLHCLDIAAAATGADPSLPPVLAAGLYYARHLGGRVPLLVVSDRLAAWMAAAAAAAPGDAATDTDTAAAGSSSGSSSGRSRWPPDETAQEEVNSALADNLAAAAAEGVTVLSAAEYVSRCWAPRSAVSELYDSLMAAKLAAASGDGDGGGGRGDAAYTPHLSQQAVEDGLAAGMLMRGVVHVSRRNPREAVVELGHGPDAALGRLVRVSGRGALNRAMEGDVVAVRLLLPGGAPPQANSSGGGAAAAANDGADDDPDAHAAEDTVPPPFENAAAAPAATATATAAADPDADYGAELLADAADGNGAAGEEGALAMAEAGLSEHALPSAEVVAILHRDPRDIVACLSQRDEAAIKARLQQQQQVPAGTGAGGGPQRRAEVLVCMPLDRRLPAVVVVTRQGAQLVGCRFVVRLDSWERNSRYPRGHVTRLLGRLNDLRAESEAVLVQCGINYKPFCEAALAELPRVTRPEDWRVPVGERTSRRDLTGPEYFVVSIDPVGCTDVDDAMHVRFLPPPDAEYDTVRQRVEVGVHIADVSWFVSSGGMLDGEARDRCTSVYLVDRRLDMLPGLLSEQLCSLRQGVERLAVSVVWTLSAQRRRGNRGGGGGGSVGGNGAAREQEVEEEGTEWEYEVEDVWFGRTVIRSRHQLHYQQAQDILDGRVAAPGDELPAEHVAVLRRSLMVLDQLTAQLHAQRVAAGALELSSVELKFGVNPTTGAPCQVESKQKIHTMDVVAEMMIAANSAVAERVAAAFPGCALLRNHPPPRPQAFEQVRALIEPYSGGDSLDPASNASLAAALERACAAAAAASDPAAATLIKSLATRAMSEAQYNSSGTTPPGTPLSYHYGLALQYYTHFTSPIRRYADVVVHRQLMAALSGGPPPQLHPDLAAAAATMNARHRQAKAAQKECSELYLLLLLHARPHVERALVCGISGSRLELFVSSYHLRAAVALTDRSGLPRPPLRFGQPEGPAAEEDPFRTAERRELRLTTTTDEATITDVTSGDPVWSVRLWQPVSVRLSAADHRAHGPKLALRLLDPSHPDALPSGPPLQPEQAAAAAPTAAGASEAAAAGAPPPPPGGGTGAAALPPHLRLLISLRDKAGIRQQAEEAGGAAAAAPNGATAVVMANGGGSFGSGCQPGAGSGSEPAASPGPIPVGTAAGSARAAEDAAGRGLAAAPPPLEQLVVPGRGPPEDRGRGSGRTPGEEIAAAGCADEDQVDKEEGGEGDKTYGVGVLGAPAPALLAMATPTRIAVTAAWGLRVGAPELTVSGGKGVPAASAITAAAFTDSGDGARGGTTQAPDAELLAWQLPEFRARLRRVSRLEMRLLACRRGSTQERKLRERLNELNASVQHLQA